MPSKARNSKGLEGIGPVPAERLKVEGEASLGKTVVKLIATGLGSGYSPFAPGTAGTLVAIPLFLALSPLSWPLYLASVSALTLLAVYASGEAERIFDRKDSPRIVIDEIVGFLWSLFLVGPTAGRIAAAFFLFRIFDILKPPPARWCQDRLPGGWGVVMDDVAAGIWANAVLQAALHFFDF
ncbi:MAG TPA: phosphatidylglycerophosphatase A [Syntrophales bacterium]|nr:phosphatidylglycerophosphatase A [Syntrophobacterales bacterium]HQL91369.1 phosphatidylglycerophosphatase A [Syntrophales bacterium]